METKPRRTRASGDRSRRKVLNQAAELATLEGLDGLSVGRLAAASGMPKSSVYQLFGSKEEIQLATVEAALASFMTVVVLPALDTEAGGKRLLALCDGFLDYVDNRVFPGGCFFVGAAAEVGGRPGRLHDRVAVIQGEWRDLLRSEAELAAERGELAPGSDPAQVAFELGTILAGTNLLSVLHDDHAVIAQARAAVRSRLAL
jgi:AcrR family transcriptional regulator